MRQLNVFGFWNEAEERQFTRLLQLYDRKLISKQEFRSYYGGGAK